MRLQAAIFDMDGTLLDSTHVWQNLGSDLLRELGIEPEDGLNEKLLTLGLHGSAAYCREHYGLTQSEDELVAMVNERVDHAYREEVQPKSGVDKLLTILKMQGVWMYVATATDRAQADAALRRTGLLPYFRGIMTCTEVGGDKRSPLIYERCLTRLRCAKPQCVVFEDSLHAIQTAKDAMFRVAAVYDAASEADQPKIQSLADYYIRSYDDFISNDSE